MRSDPGRSGQCLMAEYCLQTDILTQRGFRSNDHPDSEGMMIGSDRSDPVVKPVVNRDEPRSTLIEAYTTFNLDEVLE